MGNNDVRVNFLGDASALNRVMKSVQGQSSKTGHVLAGMGKAAAVGIASLSAAGMVGGKVLFDHAAKLQQMGDKGKTVFGNQIGVVDKWAKKNAAAMGLTSRETVGLAANFGDLLIPMGFTRQAAADMSTKVVGLSGALSQWSGGTVSAAGASDILAKAMLGERDGLKALGISISDADVKAQLLKQGQSKLTGAALQQATAQATQTLIFEKSTDAQAKFAAGGSPLLAAQAKTKAAFGEMKDTLAIGLVPVFTTVASFVTDKLVPGFQALISAFQSGGFGAAVALIGTKISDALPGILAKLGEWGQAFVDWIGPKIPPMLAKLASLLQAAGNWVIFTGVPLLTAQLAKWGHAFIDWIGPRIGPMLGKLGEMLAKVGGWLLNTALPWLVQNLAKWGLAFIEWIGPKIPPMLVELGKFIAKIGSWIITDGIPKLQEKLSELASKGIAAFVKMLGDKVKDITDWFSKLPGKIIEAIGDLGKTLVEAGKKLMLGLKDGIVEGFKSVAKTLGDITSRIPSLKGPASKDAQLLYNNGVLIMQGLQRGLEDKFAVVAGVLGGMAAKLKDSLKVGHVDAHLMQVMAAGTARLSALAAKREQLADRFAAASEKLAGLKDAKAGFIQSATEATTSGGNITGLGVDPESGETTAAGILAALQAKVAQANTFASNLVGLGNAGLSKQMLAQLASAGAEQGAASAAALNLAGADAIKQANVLQAELQKSAKTAATFAASSLYDTGIAAAQGLVEGLKSQQKAIAAQMLVIAKSMSTAIKKALGIKSPSKVFFGHGKNVGLGLVGGVESMQPAAASAAGALLGSASPSAGGARGGSGHGGDTYYLTVNAKPGSIVDWQTIEQGLLSLKRNRGGSLAFV